MPARHERKMKKMETRSAAAWDTTMAGLGEAEPQPEPEASSAAEASAAESQADVSAQCPQDTPKIPLI